MAWVKLHDDILGDPKLMRAARTGGRELVILPWLLAFASKAADQGRLSVGGGAADAEDIAYQIPGVTAEQVSQALNTLLAIDVLEQDEDGCLRFVKWEDRQAKPSSTKSAVLERVHKHRAKVKRSQKNERNTDAALQGVTEGVNGVASMPQNGSVTPCNATDKKREEEKREEKTAPSGAEPRPTRETWVTDGVTLWTSLVGTIPHVQFGAALKPIVTLHGWPAVRTDLEKWVRQRVESGKPCNPTWYAKEASARLAPKPPLVDEHGQLTEYGERMTRPEKVSA